MRARLPWQRGPEPIAGHDPSHVEWVDLVGRPISEQTIFRLEMRLHGRPIFWTEGGARAVIEHAARIAAEHVGTWHDFPETFEIELHRLRNVTPSYPKPPIEIERPK